MQRILAETSPDQQVWLNLAAITDLNLSIDIDGRVEPVKTDAVDDSHVKQVIRAIESGQFKDREAVSIAEGGLIRYLQPKYNNLMKYRFPARKQVSLEAVRALDMHGVIVELQGDHIGALYGSDTRPYLSLHFIGFIIHQDRDRAIMMSLRSVDSLIDPNKRT